MSAERLRAELRVYPSRRGQRFVLSASGAIGGLRLARVNIVVPTMPLTTAVSEKLYLEAMLGIGLAQLALLP
jgi:hypothetical protein